MLFEHGRRRKPKIEDWRPSGNVRIPKRAVFQDGQTGEWVVQMRHCHSLRLEVSRHATRLEAVRAYRAADQAKKEWQQECKTRKNYGLPTGIIWVKPLGYYSVRFPLPDGKGGRIRPQFLTDTREEALTIWRALKAAAGYPQSPR